MKKATFQVSNCDGSGKVTRTKYLMPSEDTKKSVEELMKNVIEESFNESKETTKKESVDIKNRVAFRLDYLNELRMIQERCPTIDVEERIKMTCNFIELELSKGDY